MSRTLKKRGFFRFRRKYFYFLLQKKKICYLAVPWPTLSHYRRGQPNSIYVNHCVLFPQRSPGALIEKDFLESFQKSIERYVSKSFACLAIFPRKIYFQLTQSAVTFEHMIRLLCVIPAILLFSKDLVTKSFFSLLFACIFSKSGKTIQFSKSSTCETKSNLNCFR